MIEAVEEFEGRQWDPKVIRENAERFSIAQFRRKFTAVTKKEWMEFLVQRIESNRNSMFGLSDTDISDAGMPGSSRRPDAEMPVAELPGVEVNQ